MTPLSRMMACFPALVLVLSAVCTARLLVAPSFAATAALLFVLYGFPLLAFRVHGIFFPVREGLTRLDRPKYSPWWGGHQIQLVYISFPSLETAIRMVPGLYSAWMRAWGSKIGKNVYWTPRMQVLDRNLLEIGDNVIFGHIVILCCHVVNPRKNRMTLLVSRIRLGNDSFVGAASRLGPGVTVADGVKLPGFSDLFLKNRMEET